MPLPENGRALTRTKEKGIYRRGRRYVVRARIDGREHKFAARSMEEAKRIRLAAAVQPEGLLGQREAGGPAGRAPLLKDYVETWLRRYRGRTDSGIRASTKREYRRDLELHVLPSLGQKRLDEITQVHIRRLVDDLLSGDDPLAPGSVRNAIAPLKALFASAVEWGHLSANPAREVRLPGTPKGRRPKALTEPQLKRLMKALPPDGRLLVEFLSVTGVRASEAFGLRWHHIDFAAGRASIECRRRGNDIDVPKSESSNREVRLSPTLVKHLRAARRRAGAAAEDFVFLSPHGRPIDHNNFLRRTFRPACEQAGVPWAGLHTLRHTCATRLLRSDVSAEKVALLLGHASPGFTVKVYGHLGSEDLPDPTLLDV